SEQLQASQLLYRTVVETTDTGYVMLDKEGRVLDANEEYVRLTGHASLDQIRGRSVLEWTAPHDLARNGDEIERCLSKGMVRDLRIDYLDAEGKVVPIEINATFVYVDGKPRILSLCRDVADRLRAETERVRADELAHAALESLPASVAVLDSDGRILAV